jgi:hypothetical protein
MKTFREFIDESSATQRVISRAIDIIKNISPERNPEKFHTYINLIRKSRERLPKEPEGREHRKDKFLEPTYRLSPEEIKNNPPTPTKNPKKLRKQRALGELL